MKHDGWVPFQVTWQGETGAFVDWCWLGGERFTDPFFDGTIEVAMGSPFNGLFMHRTSVAELGAWHAASPGLEPSGFIFHMSRCGSTLISQMLASSPQNVVISEARPLDRIARAASIRPEVKAEWLRWMVSALGQKRAGKETRYFIKFDSPTTIALPLIRSVFPSVPWIFLYRDPVEVLASHLRQPAAAMASGTLCDISLIDAPMQDVFRMSVEEYAARAIGRICECARLAMDQRGLLINYTQLPQAMMGEIARHFAVDFSDDEVTWMQDTTLYHAKRARTRFEADGENKRAEVDNSARQAAARWIAPHYAALERLRTAVSPKRTP